MNLTNEQIARVFAMYYGCQYMDIDWKESHKVLYPTDIPPNSCKLLLKPLSAITDDDARIVAKLAWGDPEINHDYIIITDSTERSVGFSFRIHNSLGIEFCIQFSSFYSPVLLCLNRLEKSDEYLHNAAFIYEYLKQQSYAVPLFIAPNHPANGKTAIELGLAIEQH